MFKEVYLEPKNKTFSEVMSNGKSYNVPPFQRDYTWGEEQLDELWQDIERMKSNQNQHFMGYLVLQSTDNKAFEIVDGQQRITTITLLIIAILAKFKKFIEDGIDRDDNETRKDVMHTRYLGVLDVVTLITSPKLSLNRNNNQHFHNIIDFPYGIPRHRSLTTTNRKLNKSFEFFLKQLEAYQSKDLAELITALEEGLLFTAITVKSDLDAFLVFETLNARGVHLSAPDLLKNYLLSTLQPNEKNSSVERIEQFESKWNQTIEQLGETNFTTFLRSYEGMSSTLKHKKDLYRYLKTKRIKKAEEVMPYVKDLSEKASVYAALQNPDDEFWKGYGDGQYSACIEDLRTLKLFNIKTPLSLLMAAYVKYSASNFNKLVKWLVVISVRYNVICQKSTNDQENTYNKISMSIMNGTHSSVNDLKGPLKPVYVPDDDFYTSFATKTMPSRQSKKKVVYLLRAIETHVGNGDAPSESLTLEHVLPYNPTDQWQREFGYETYNDAIDRLGNFALLTASKNREMGQQLFHSKKEVLNNSGIKINKQIASHDHWDIDALNEQQKWLARQAKTVWRID